MNTVRASIEDILESVSQTLDRYVSLGNPHLLTAVTLWVAHTHIFDQFDCTPYLGITSAEPRSGKTRLLEVLELLVRDPYRAVQPTEAVIFRKVDQSQPTLLIDEVDTIFGDRHHPREELRALLNAGYRKGSMVPRVDGANRTLREFSVFSPKALAGIGHLPNTIADRCIQVRLRRRARHEKVERFRQRYARPQTEPIRKDLVDWAQSVDLSEARPGFPARLNDRAEDVWEPPFAIADEAGGTWPEKARQAAVYLNGESEEPEASRGVQLLQDLRELFNDSEKNQIPTRDLISTLNSLGESPWGGLYEGKGIGARYIAQKLRAYGIRPRTIRIKEETWKGYTHDDMKDTFERYLSPPPAVTT